jgi:hypothetical protein
MEIENPFTIPTTALWRNAVATRVASTATHVLFTVSEGGFVYRTTREEWLLGRLSAVEA